mmetsp:Transcript_6533/g.9863  ORF Transcript_6533/g.9863 Transcript_6533/m.9863 type:complete len:305 (+) Transcript_6533:239-1153(+)
MSSLVNLHWAIWSHLGANDSGDVGAVLVGRVQEGDDLVDGVVLQHQHVLGHVLGQGQEAPLRVVPSIRAQLLVVGLQALDDPADAKLEVALGAVQGANHQVHNAQVEALAVGLRVRHALLLLLNLAHELLGLLVLAGHDAAHAEVGQHYGRGRQDVVAVLLHNRVVVPDRLLELGLLHEEDVGHVQLPGVVLRAELRGLAEQALHHGVVLPVPVDAGHGHKHRDVALQRLVVLLQALLDGIVVSGHTGILDLLRQLAQVVYVLCGQLVILPVGFLWRGLYHDSGIQVVIQVLRKELVCKVSVFC